MFRSRSLLAVTALSLVVGVAGSASAAPPVQQAETEARASRPAVKNASKLDRSAFESLSDDDVVDVRGKSMTKREVLKQAMALRDAKGDDSEKETFETERAASAQKQKAALDAENAPVMAKMQDLRKAASELRVTPGLSAKATPSASATATPELKGMLGQLKPGSAVILFGTAFGALEGEVRMYGTFPNGFIKLSVDSWGNGGIGVLVPTTVTGVFDQQVTLKIVTKAGASSNYKTAPFTAARELRKMKMSEFSTQQCRDAALSSDKCVTVGQSGCTSSVCGSHAVPVLGGAASTDRFKATLKNGWTYDHYGFEGGIAFSPGPQEWINPIVLLETYLLGNDKPTVKNLSTAGAPSFEIPWSVPSLWSDTYKLNVYVLGPAGTPHV
jgi:hypothetical protein